MSWAPPSNDFEIDAADQPIANTSSSDVSKAKARAAKCREMPISFRMVLLGVSSAAVIVILTSHLTNLHFPYVVDKSLVPLLPGMPPWSSAEIALGDIRGVILSIGDWGCGHAIPAGCPTSDGQQHVAHVMGDPGNAAVDFVLNLGDNFYPNGVSGHEDEQWNSTFEDIYSSKHLQVPWYGVLGNHDWHRNASAQIRRHGRWQIPALAYTLKGRAEGVPFTFFMIDTNIVLRSQICRGRNESDWGPLSHAEMEICRHGLAAMFEPQLRWLTSELAKARSELKIVVGHEPVYGTGRWAFAGDESDFTLQKHLDPLLHREKVHAYISGHDHLLQHLSLDGLDYFISGAGGGELEDDGLCHRTAARVVAHFDGLYGYSRININRTHFCMTFLSNSSTTPEYRHCKMHGVEADA